jgi:hypothetical protein
MHTYLRAIGFSGLEKKTDLDILLKEVIKNPDSRKVIETREGHSFAEFTKDFAPDCGLCVCGEYDEKTEFRQEYHFPYLIGSGISSTEEVIIERQSDKESYIGACDDLRLDISLIFHLINTADYLRYDMGDMPEHKTTVLSLSALSVEGKILLPILRSENEVQERRKKVQKRSAMILAARNGDEDAMENLTMDDMDTFNEVTRRAQKEDIYSIVDNCFMPYGFGSDIYSVVGDICDFQTVTNSFTGEQLVKLNLVCNGVSMDVCINEKDLLGAPQIGRRFKGVIWLQGVVEF